MSPSAETGGGRRMSSMVKVSKGCQKMIGSIRKMDPSLGSDAEIVERAITLLAEHVKGNSGPGWSMCSNSHACGNTDMFVSTETCPVCGGHAAIY